MNPDPDADLDSSIFIIDLQDANKKQIKKKSISAYSIPLTNGSETESRRSKNTWIRWIRIRIRNTD
jgi:hypothetical protein